MIVNIYTSPNFSELPFIKKQNIAHFEGRWGLHGFIPSFFINTKKIQHT